MNLSIATPHRNASTATTPHRNESTAGRYRLASRKYTRPTGSAIDPEAPPPVRDLGPLDFEVWHEGGQRWLFVALGESGDVLAVIPAGRA
jgi:hypothetical protein